MSLVKVLDQKDDIDIIILHLQGFKGAFELSPALEQKLEDLNFCRDLIRTYGSRSKVTAMLRSGRSMTSSKADRVYQDTLHVFNTTQASHRDFWIDTAMGMFLETRKKALEALDFLAVSKVENNIANLIKLMSDSKESEIYARLHVPQIQLVFDPTITGVELPDDWEVRVKQIITKAHAKDLSDIPEAIVVKPTENE